MAYNTHVAQEPCGRRSPRLERERVGRIGILRALYLGDLLCAVPAWRAVRRAFPTAHITLIGLPWAETFVSRFGAYVDDFLAFPGFPGLPEVEVSATRFLKFLRFVQQRPFDLLLQMHGNGRYTNLCVPLMGVKRAAGFYAPGEYCPDEQWFMPYPEGRSEVHRHLDLMTFLGIPLHGDHLEFPLTDADEAAHARWAARAMGGDAPYVCVHPGGRGALRRWAPERFAELADVVARKGFRIVITGTADEAPLAEAMQRAMRSPAISAVGHTDLGTLGVLLRGARLLIANDTGVSHVAAALRVPSVIIVTGSDPARWAPLDRRRHRIHLGPDATLDGLLADVDALLLEPCAVGELV